MSLQSTPFGAMDYLGDKLHLKPTDSGKALKMGLQTCKGNFHA